jgi:hypothetical protein
MNKPFTPYTQVFPSLHILQSAVTDRTVHCNRLYGPLWKTVQSTMEDRNNRQEEKP